jgi:hypothetical protein
MSAIRGYPSQQKLDRTTIQFVTVEPVHKEQNGASVVAHQYVYEVGTDAAEAGSTVGKIVATGHLCVEGDVIRFTSGVHNSKEIKVVSVVSNDINLAEDLSAEVGVGDTFQILRHKYPLVESDGSVKISGSFTATEQAVAADGAALPALVKVAGGYDGSAVQVLKTDANGELQVDVLSSALPTGAATESTLSGIDAKLGSLGQKAMAGSAPVVIASDQSAIPISGSVSVSNNANGTPGVAIPAEATMVGGSDGTLLRPLKTDVNGELQIDVISSVLPTGAASETRQVDGNQKTQITSGGSSASVLAISSGLNSVTSSGLVTMSELYGTPSSGGNPVKIRTTDTFGRLSVDINSMPAGTATASNQTDGSQKSQLVDAGGDVAEIKALNVALLATDKGIITSSTIHGLSTAGGGTYVDVKVNPSGALTVEADITSSALPTGAATETTLATLATEATVSTLATEATLATLATEATVATLATEATVSTLATEATAASIDGKLPATLGQKTMANSLAVVLSSDQSAIPVTGSFTAGALSVVDLVDGDILDTSVVNIPGSASSPVEVVASLAANVKMLQLLDTTGAFLGLYEGASGSEVLKLVIGPGSDQTIEHGITAGSRISLKRLDGTAVVASGIVAINFLG